MIPVKLQYMRAHLLWNFNSQLPLFEDIGRLRGLAPLLEVLRSNPTVVKFRLHWKLNNKTCLLAMVERLNVVDLHAVALRCRSMSIGDIK